MHKIIKRICAVLIAIATFSNALVTPVYAEKSYNGQVQRIKSWLTGSIDVRDYKFQLQFYKQILIKSYLTTNASISSLDFMQGLSPEKRNEVIGVINDITAFFSSEAQEKYGVSFSKAAIAGMLGNIYGECEYNCTAVGSNAYGMIQWMGGRKTKADKFLAERGTSFSQKTSLHAQMEFIMEELLNDGYLNRLNKYTKMILGANGCEFKDLEDPILAADAWAVVFEGCVRSGPVQSIDAQAKDQDGTMKTWQHLQKRRNHADSMFSCLNSGAASINDTPDLQGSYFMYPITNGSNNNVPYYSQGGGAPWSDVPFGHLKSDGTPQRISGAGCSVTSCAMIMSFLQQKFIYPDDIVRAITNENPETYTISPAVDIHFGGGGVQGDEVRRGVAAAYGYVVRGPFYNIREIDSYLKMGYPAMMHAKGKPSLPDNVRFTANGHFLCVTGMDNAGGYRINDPNGNHKDYMNISFTPQEITYRGGDTWWVFVDKEASL